MSRFLPDESSDDGSANISLFESLQDFESACQLQDEMDDVVVRHEQALLLRDRAAQLREQKRIIWAPDNLPLRLGGIYNPIIALNYISEVAYNGVLEWRADRLLSQADDLSSDEQSE